jgi:hypothetical protein
MRGSGIAVVLLVWLGAAAARAEDEATPPAGAADAAATAPAKRWADYDLDGEVSVGYRAVDVSGSTQRYDSHYNLQSGVRLFSVGIHGRADDPAEKSVDRFSLDIETPNDEPVSNYRLRVSNDERWDLRGALTQTTWDYAWPQLFEGPVPDDSSVADLHRFDVRRTRGNLDLTYHVTDDLSLIGGWRLNRRAGDTISTIYVEGADTFIVPRPVAATTNTGVLGGDLRALGTDFSLRQEYQSTNRVLGAENPLPGDRSGLDDTDTARLNQFSGDQNETISAPVTIVRVRRPFGERAEVNGSYFYRHADLDLDAQLLEAGRTSTPGFPSRNFRVSSGDATLNMHVVDLVGSVRILDRLSFITSYRYDDRTQDGTVLSRDAFGLLDANAGYHVSLNRGSAELLAEPRDDLTVRAGMQYGRQDSEFTNAGSAGTDLWGAVADVRWRPWKPLDVFGRYESLQIDDPFESAGGSIAGQEIPSRQIALTFQNRGQAGLRLRPWKWAMLQYRFLADSRQNSTFDGLAQTFGNDVGLTLTPRPGLDFFVSYTRRDLQREADILIAPLYDRVLSLQNGSEDVITSSLTWAFQMLEQSWSTGWTVSWFDSNQSLLPHLETSGSGRTTYDVERVDGSVFLNWRHRWIEPSVSFRYIDYRQRPLGRNDYQATLVTVALTKRWSN